MLKKETGRKDDRFRLLLFLLLTVVCLAVGMGAFFYSSPMKDKLFSPEGRWMLGETLLIFIWQLFFLYLPKWFLRKLPRGKETIIRITGIGLGLGFGLWCHQILLPFLVSGCWLAGLFLFGDVIFRCGNVMDCRRDAGKKKGYNGYFRLFADFLMGSAGWICLVCILSAFRFGGVGRMRLVAAALMFALLLETGAEIWGKAKAERAGENTRKVLWQRVKKHGANCRRKAESLDGMEKLFTAVILTMVFVQLARINLMPDYDSLHYGLRSHYILDAGHGIYEDLGNIHLVYTYAKGWEILTFPLCGTITYGFILCFNLWMAVLAVVLAGGLAFRISQKRRTGFFCGMLIALIPGIMNMGITAKSDLLTLVCQMCILWAAVEIFKTPRAEEKTDWFCIALSACMFSFAFKPTALVFSTMLSLCCLGALIQGRGFSSEKSGEGERAGGRFFCVVSLLLPVLLCVGAMAGTWTRTYRMVGVPTTSVFTSIWEKLGFSVQWPYAFSAIPNEGMRIEAGERAAFWIKRLLGILFGPAGNDMFHVRLAWGTSVVFLGLTAWLLWGMGKGKEKNCLKVSLIVMGLFNLLSLYLLPQVDGNYYMLYYVLAAMAGSFALENASLLGDNDKEEETSSSRARAIGVVFSGFLLIQTGIILGTNWAGTKGFTPVKLLHSGVVNHQQERFAEKCASGNQGIWHTLARDPRTRVIAAGDHPMVLQFPCNVQSYYDITGSGGNVRLVKTLEEFKKFLRFAKTEYIYVEAGYLEEGSRAYDVIRYLIEEGSLVQLRFEAGNMLGKVNLDGELFADPQKEAADFYKQIRMMVPEDES